MVLTSVHPAGGAIVKVHGLPSTLLQARTVMLATMTSFATVPAGFAMVRSPTPNTSWLNSHQPGVLVSLPPAVRSVAWVPPYHRVRVGELFWFVRKPYPPSMTFRWWANPPPGDPFPGPVGP